MASSPTFTFVTSSITIEDLKADNQPYQEELTFVKRAQSCADIARRDREQAGADTSGRSEEKREKQMPVSEVQMVQAEYLPEKPGQQQTNQPVKKRSILQQLDEKKQICAERDKNRQAVKKKRNHDMSL